MGSSAVLMVPIYTRLQHANMNNAKAEGCEGLPVLRSNEADLALKQLLQQAVIAAHATDRRWRRLSTSQARHLASWRRRGEKAWERLRGSKVGDDEEHVEGVIDDWHVVATWLDIFQAVFWLDQVVMVVNIGMHVWTRLTIIHAMFTIVSKPNLLIIVVKTC